jgi:hypothetical protein
MLTKIVRRCLVTMIKLMSRELYLGIKFINSRIKKDANPFFIVKINKNKLKMSHLLNIHGESSTLKKSQFINLMYLGC